MVDQSAHVPKFEGLNPDTAGTRRKMVRKNIVKGHPR